MSNPDAEIRRVPRFLWILVRPWLAPLAIPFLLVAWLVLTVIVVVWGAWREAAT